MSAKHGFGLVPRPMRAFRPQSLHTLRCIPRFSHNFPLKFPTRVRIPPFQLRAFHKSTFRRNAETTSTPDESKDVRLRRRVLTRRNILLMTLQGVAFYMFLVWLGNGLNSMVDEETLKMLDLEDGKGGEEEVAPLFIPCWYPTKQPLQFYKASDPDWMAFASLSKDKERQRKVKEQAAARCAQSLAANPLARRLLGDGIRLGGRWLEFKFPDGPPAEYLRYGIIWADDYIAWGSEVIPQSEYIRIRNMLWPHHLFHAIQRSLIMFARFQRLNVKEALGWTLTDEDKRMAHARKLVMEAAPKSDPSGSSVDGKAAADVGHKEVQSQVDGNDASSSPKSPEPDAIENPLLSTLLSAGDALSARSRAGLDSLPTMKATSMLFIGQLMQNWTAAYLDAHPEGACFIVGQIEIYGPKGKARCDVLMGYDPKENTFKYQICKVKYFWEARQVAKGGP